ncbi:MAG: translesion DNA synthesis-associated protein ImuA [Gammaproteobacteria bacterium]
MKNLDHLLHYPNPWAAPVPPAPAAGMSTGFAELDALLPEAGWIQNALTEVLVPQEGVGALQLLLPALARLSQQRRWIAWVAPPYVPYAPALAAAGVDPGKVLRVHPRAAGDGLATVERCLRSGTCGAVLAWPMAGDGPALRRLQAAAAEGRSWGILFRPDRLAGQPSAAAQRLKVVRSPHGLELSLVRPRGGWAAGPVSLSMDRLLAQPLRNLC